LEEADSESLKATCCGFLWCRLFNLSTLSSILRYIVIRITF